MHTLEIAFKAFKGCFWLTDDAICTEVILLSNFQFLFLVLLDKVGYNDLVSIRDDDSNSRNSDFSHYDTEFTTCDDSIIYDMNEKSSVTICDRSREKTLHFDKSRG